MIVIGIYRRRFIGHGRRKLAASIAMLFPPVAVAGIPFIPFFERRRRR